MLAIFTQKKGRTRLIAIKSQTPSSPLFVLCSPWSVSHKSNVNFSFFCFIFAMVPDQSVLLTHNCHHTWGKLLCHQSASFWPVQLFKWQKVLEADHQGQLTIKGHSQSQSCVTHPWRSWLDTASQRGTHSEIKSTQNQKARSQDDYVNWSIVTLISLDEDELKALVVVAIIVHSSTPFFAFCALKSKLTVEFWNIEQYRCQSPALSSMQSWPCQGSVN